MAAHTDTAPACTPEPDNRIADVGKPGEREEAEIAAQDSRSAAHDVAALRAELAECRQNLHALQRMQAAMAHGLSHDLRAPLRAIKGYASVLANAPRLQASLGVHVRRIDAAATRMASLVDALLELSRVERAPLRLQHTDVSLLAEWAGAELADAHPGVDIDLQVQDGLHAWTDESLLKQALRCLLDNALQFSTHAPPVRIRVEGAVHGDRLQVHVRDAGRGFDPDYAERIMEPFRRLHSGEDGAGAGLGLAIAERIARRLGGRLSAHSDGVDCGSCFTLDLPAAAGTGP